MGKFSKFAFSAANDFDIDSKQLTPVVADAGALVPSK